MKYLFMFLFLLSTTVFAKPIKVMVVDTGVYPHKEFKQHIKQSQVFLDDYMDMNGHGTHVAGIVLKEVCSEVELISCRYYSFPMNKDNLDRTVYCFTRALQEDVDFVNYSSSGPTADVSEFRILKALEEKGITVVVAAGNNKKNLKKKSSFPASYKLKNLIVVGNLRTEGHRSFTSNFGLPGMVWEFGENVYSTLPDNKYGRLSGTSQAAAIHMNKLIKKKCSENANMQ